MSRVILFLYTNDYDATSLPGFYLKRYPDAQDLVEPSEDQDRDDYSTMFHALRVHALVYQYADTLGIDDLKIKASGRFLEIAQAAFALDGFEEPLQVMFESTHSNDIPLRLEVTRLCLANYDSLIEDRKKTLEVVKEYEPNVFNVYAPLLCPLMQVKEKLEISQDSLEATKARLEIVQSAGLELANTLKAIGIQCSHRQSVRLKEVESKDGTLLTIKVCYNCRYCDMYTGGD
jgi:hypothetical protein